MKVLLAIPAKVSMENSKPVHIEMICLQTARTALGGVPYGRNCSHSETCDWDVILSHAAEHHRARMCFAVPILRASSGRAD